MLIEALGILVSFGALRVVSEHPWICPRLHRWLLAPCITPSATPILFFSTVYGIVSLRHGFGAHKDWFTSALAFGVAGLAASHIVVATRRAAREASRVRVGRRSEASSSSPTCASSPLPDHYRVLGVSPGADLRALRRAWRRQTLRWHPDQTKGSVETYRAIVAAYKVLSDPRKRAEYDRRRGQEQTA